MPSVPEGFDAAYPVLFRRAYRSAYRLLGTRAEAEDVAQETLTRALVRWRRIESYAEPWGRSHRHEPRDRRRTAKETQAARRTGRAGDGRRLRR